MEQPVVDIFVINISYSINKEIYAAVNLLTEGDDASSSSSSASRLTPSIPSINLLSLITERRLRVCFKSPPSDLLPGLEGAGAKQQIRTIEKTADDRVRFKFQKVEICHLKMDTFFDK